MNWIRKLLEYFWEKYIFFSRQYYYVFILLYLIITSISIYYALHLELKTDIKNLVSESKSYQNYEELKKKLGGLNTINLLLEIDKKNSTQTKEERKINLINAADLFIENFNNNSFLNKNTKNIFYKIPIEKIEKYALLYLEVDELNEIYNRLTKTIRSELKLRNPFSNKIKKHTVPFYIDDILHKYENENRRSPLLIDSSNNMLVIIIKPSSSSSDFEFANRYIKELQSTIETSFHKDEKENSFSLEKANKREIGDKIITSQGGVFIRNYENNNSIQNDIKKTSVLTIAVLILFIVLFFHSLRTFFVIGLPLFSSLGITFSLAWVFIGHINIISAFLTSILLGLGIDYGIHLYVRFKEERTRGNGTSAALVITFSRLSLSIVFAAFTTAIAFFALMFSEFRAFYEFGFIAAIGIFSSVISFFLFFPFLIFVTEKINPISASFMPIQNQSTRHLWSWIVLAVVFSSLGMYSLFQKRYEYNFDKLQIHSKNQKKIEDKIAGILSIQKSSPIVYSFNSLQKLTLFNENMQKRKHALKGSTASLAHFLPRYKNEKLLIIRKINAALSAARLFVSQESREYNNLEKSIWYTDYHQFHLNLLPDELINIFLYENPAANTKEYFYYLYPQNVDQLPNGTMKFTKEFRQTCIDGTHWRKCDKEKRIDGVSESIILLDILNMIKRDSWHILWFMVVSILIGIAIVIRNFYGYILILTPLVSGILTWFGITWILQITTHLPEFSFNYISIVGFPVIVGLGIDNGFHLFRKGQEIGLNKLNTIFKETGTAVFLSNFNTFIGFLSLAFSSHPGLRSLGIMTSIGIVIIYLSFRYLFAASSLLFYQKNWLSEDETP